MTLTWEHEGEVDYFTVYRSVDNEVLTETATTTGTSYTENLTNDFDRIEYSVSAVNPCGESELAGPVVVRPKGR